MQEKSFILFLLRFSESRLSPNYTNFLPNINACNVDPNMTFPELKIVVTKMIPHGNGEVLMVYYDFIY